MPDRAKDRLNKAFGEAIRSVQTTGVDVPVILKTMEPQQQVLHRYVQTRAKTLKNPHYLRGAAFAYNALGGNIPIKTEGFAIGKEDLEALDQTRREFWTDPRWFNPHYREIMLAEGVDPTADFDWVVDKIQTYKDFLKGLQYQLGLLQQSENKNWFVTGVFDIIIPVLSKEKALELERKLNMG